jgi:hypothetical protein
MKKIWDLKIEKVLKISSKELAQNITNVFFLFFMFSSLFFCFWCLKKNYNLSICTSNDIKIIIDLVKK